MALCACLIIGALIPQLLAYKSDSREKIVYESPEPTQTEILRSLLKRLTPTFLQRTRVQARSPWETPPTAYLPYAPPPDYVWPPGPHTQYPPPSETNAPGGWYGGTGTGGQGNSGAGSASNAGSTSLAAPRLRVPSMINLLAYLLPSSLIPARDRRQIEREKQRLKPRDPLETPPTQFLPYPPPPNYQWPPGQSPGNQYPQPSEFDPPPGVYGSGNNNPYPNPNSASGGSTVSPSTGQAGGGGWGRRHVAWVVIVTIISTALVVGGLAWWYRGKRLGAASKAPAEAGGKKEKKKQQDGGFMALLGKGKFWGKNEGDTKAKAAPQPPVPPAANSDTDD
ncbi:MAG: hypothetical protein Q9169_000616 [Polycauliona sp. 2 TL-2023]